jgi:hypothetical protein
MKNYLGIMLGLLATIMTDAATYCDSNQKRIRAQLWMIECKISPSFFSDVLDEPIELSPKELDALANDIQTLRNMVLALKNQSAAAPSDKKNQNDAAPKASYSSNNNGGAAPK